MSIDIKVGYPKNSTEIERYIQICIESGLRSAWAALGPYDQHLSLFAFKDSTVIGGLVCLMDDHEVEVDTFAIQQQFRGRGIDKILLKELSNQLKNRGIDIVKFIPKSGTERYYTRMGSSYNQPNDGYMVRPL